MRKQMSVDEQLINKMLDKYGYSFDMAIVMKDYSKLDTNKLEAILRGTLKRGNLAIARECDVEEFISKSYSVYMRRMGRMKRKLLIEHYGDMYEDTLKTAHKALIADRPNIVEDDRVLVELKGGRVDHDALCDPRYISLQKVKIIDGITSVKVSCNSKLHKFIWSHMININLLICGSISKVYDCEAIFGRATSLSVRDETIARFSRGKEKQVVSGKGLLDDELYAMGLTVNGVLDAVDINLGALYCTREIEVTIDAIQTMCANIGAKDSWRSLIKYLDTNTIPQIRNHTTLPRFTTLYNFSKKFITAEKQEKIDKDQIESMAATLAAVISKYLMYISFLKTEPQAEMKFYVLNRLRSSKDKSTMGVIEPALK